MLLQLTPDQIGAHWDEIKPALMAALPPTATPTPEGMQFILEGLMKGHIQAWVLYANTDAGTVIHAMAFTYVQREMGTHERLLLIYALYGYRATPNELWASGMEGLKAFARSEGCSRIVAYTKVPRVVEIMKALGGNTEWTFLSMEVPK